MEPRPTYAPSGRVNSADLWPTALALSAGAGLSAVVLALATRGDGDMGFGFWFVPTFGFFCAGRMLVRHAHCRSPRLAAALMVSVGLLAVAGGFHIDQCRRWGV